jgi:hypothetical protein
MKSEAGSTNLEALPPDLRDLPRFCHPMWFGNVKFKSKSRSGALRAPPAYGLAPLVGARVASLRCPYSGSEGEMLRLGFPQ